EPTFALDTWLCVLLELDMVIQELRHDREITVHMAEKVGEARSGAPLVKLELYRWKERFSADHTVTNWELLEGTHHLFPQLDRRHNMDCELQVLPVVPASRLNKL